MSSSLQSVGPSPKNDGFIFRMPSLSQGEDSHSLLCQDVLVIARSECPLSDACIQLLQLEGVEFQSVTIKSLPNYSKECGLTTDFPQIYYRHKYWGGIEELQAAIYNKEDLIGCMQKVLEDSDIESISTDSEEHSSQETSQGVSSRGYLSSEGTDNSEDMDRKRLSLSSSSGSSTSGCRSRLSTQRPSSATMVPVRVNGEPDLQDHNWIRSIVYKLQQQELGFHHRTHIYRLGKYKQCFQGQYMVDWFQQNLHLTRSQGRDLGESLRRHGYLVGVGPCFRRMFRDDDHLYRLMMSDEPPSAEVRSVISPLSIRSVKSPEVVNAPQQNVQTFRPELVPCVVDCPDMEARSILLGLSKCSQLIYDTISWKNPVLLLGSCAMLLVLRSMFNNLTLLTNVGIITMGVVLGKWAYSWILLNTMVFENCPTIINLAEKEELEDVVLISWVSTWFKWMNSIATFPTLLDLRTSIFFFVCGALLSVIGTLIPTGYLITFAVLLVGFFVQPDTEISPDSRASK